MWLATIDGPCAFPPRALSRRVPESVWHRQSSVSSASSPLRNMCLVILPSAHTLSFPVFCWTTTRSRLRSARLLWGTHTCVLEVSGIATLSSRQRTLTERLPPLSVATSLFDSVVSVPCADGTKIALTSEGKSRLPQLKNGPEGGFREKDRSHAREGHYLADLRLPVQDARCGLEPGGPGMGTRSGSIRLARRADSSDRLGRDTLRPAHRLRLPPSRRRPPRNADSQIPRRNDCPGHILHQHGRRPERARVSHSRRPDLVRCRRLQADSSTDRRRSARALRLRVGIPQETIDPRHLELVTRRHLFQRPVKAVWYRVGRCRQGFQLLQETK